LIELQENIQRHAVVDVDGWAWFDDCNCVLAPIES
jgi:hypothetical protein